ncbi:MAG: NrsF family protein [Caulobacteraceae bacterium]
MSRSTEDLIAALAAEVRPIRRLKPPLTRAALWLLATVVVGAAAIVALADMPGFMARAASSRTQIELAATALTGLAGVIAAFHLALPDRPRTWALLPLPFLAVWLSTSGLGCYQAWIARGPDGLTSGPSLHCLLFILATSLPVGGFLFWSLAKARPLFPTSTAVVGGLGVAALCAFLLQFFHPFEVTLMDLALHLVAISLVVTAASTAGARGLASALRG